MDRITENKNVLTATVASLFVHAAVVMILLAATSNPLPRLLEGGDSGYIMVSLVAGEIKTSEAAPVLSSPPQRRAAIPEEKRHETPTAGKSNPVERREIPPVRFAVLGNGEHRSNPPSAAVSYPSGSGGIEGLAVHAVNGGTGGTGERRASIGRKISMAVPKYRENAHPRYPMLARSRGEEGVVLLSAEVLANGKVGGLRIKRTSGYELLDQSALKAVKQWRFEPATRMGLSITVWVEIPVRFALRDSDG